MVDHLTFAQENEERIRSVENSFGPAGKTLYQPGRILIGEGRLIKQGRRRLQPKVFFLFNDVLVYGRIIVNGRWHTKQQIIPLEEIQLEDLEDGRTMRNQWLIRTPRKSFYVAAPSYQEKQAWIKHIEDCQSRLEQRCGLKRRSTFAVTWIPNEVSPVCMRCTNKFSVAQRRHHCRKCGFVVCSTCSKKRAVIRNIHPTKCLRVCTMCHSSLTGMEAEAEDTARQRGNSTEEDYIESSEDEGAEEQMKDPDPGTWMDGWSPYMWFNPGHTHPQTLPQADAAAQK